MKRCRAWRNRIPEAIYGDLDARALAKLNRHLSGCESCAGLYRGMADTVRKFEARPAPDRDPRYWEDYWDRLERRMAPATPGSRRAFPVPRWAYGAAGALLFVALGIFIGRTFFPSSVEPARLTKAAAPGGHSALETRPASPLLAERASRYLRRSRVLLLAVVNSDPRAGESFSLNLPLQKKVSNELAGEAAVLRKELGSSDRRLERLVSDLEMILLQIANLKSDSDVSAVEIIKAGVESRDILFKINLNEVRRMAGKPSAGMTPGADRANLTAAAAA